MACVCVIFRPEEAKRCFEDTLMDVDRQVLHAGTQVQEERDSLECAPCENDQIGDLTRCGGPSERVFLLQLGQVRLTERRAVQDESAYIHRQVEQVEDRFRVVVGNTDGQLGQLCQRQNAIESGSQRLLIVVDDLVGQDQFPRFREARVALVQRFLAFDANGSHRVVLGLIVFRRIFLVIAAADCEVSSSVNKKRKQSVV